jgi:hypothetical protein
VYVRCYAAAGDGMRNTGFARVIPFFCGIWAVFARARLVNKNSLG